MKPIDEISGDVVGAAIEIHRDLGPGLLETVYETLLAAKLERMGYRVARQVPVDIVHDGLRFEAALRLDLLVEDCLIVEIKSVERLNGAHAKQVLTYLRLTNHSVGLLINFAGETLKEGVRRLVNNHNPSVPSAPLRDSKKD